MIQANLGDQWTILLIAGKAQFSCIIAIWNSVTARRLEDTPLRSIGTRPPIRILNCWEFSETLAIAHGFSHVCAVVAKRLNLGAASQRHPHATVCVALVEKCWVVILTLVFANSSALVAPICAILVRIAKLAFMKAQGSVFALIACMIAADGSLGFSRLHLS